MSTLRHLYALTLIIFLSTHSFAQTPDACSIPMPGYTKLGEFEGHGYYLSDTLMNWVDADAYTKANGQFLISINSQAENDFIHGLVSEMVLIGLNDLEEEGQPVWTNGDSLVYTNYSDCSWCSTNDENHNFGVMVPWDGTWILDHYFRSAKHIIELPCGNLTSEIEMACPNDIWVEIPQGQLSVPVTWDLPVVSTDCLVNDTVIISQTMGAESGSDFIEGVYTIGYQAVDSCSSLAECTFTVTTTMPQDTGCGDLEGFTKLGEFEGHGYYMSNEASTWQDAKDFAEAAGGYLATMNTKNENDFVQLHLGLEMVFIGYNDATIEGQGAWANGEPVSLDLSYSNDSLSDYAVMNFWNGRWVMVNQWVYKKYILEMDCGGASPTSITMDCPQNMEVTLPEDSAFVQVNWDLPTVSTTCTNDTVLLTQTLGQTSGAYFEQGNHTIAYAATDSCGNIETCSFEITVSSAGACGPIVGYTLLGEYNGHAYYLSDEALHWVDAQFAAASDGGYLATINSQAENDFLKGVIGHSLPFIGYSDADTEGTGTWANGDSMTLDLSFNNTDENDFAVINFWAGTWQMVNQWVTKKYVMEIECGAAQGGVAPAPILTTSSWKPTMHDIYPNPADDYITVRLTNPQEKNIQFKIYDARGQVFLSEKRTLPRGASELEFEITKLPAGMYFLQLGQGEYRRFVKMD
ncbi:MAG TPA: HYR domain-containing protein [Saprospiraceae bacterium]|nr:HYR domain-containing protein [Saprospiraceae bacterium]